MEYCIFLNQYFVQYNYFSSQQWQYGYQKLVPYVQKNESHYDKIVVSNKLALDQSYIFFLFYLSYSPEEYQKITINNTGYTPVHKFEKYEFRVVTQKDLQEGKKNVLYVIGDEIDTQNAHVIKKIYFDDNSLAMQVIGR